MAASKRAVGEQAYGESCGNASGCAFSRVECKFWLTDGAGTVAVNSLPSGFRLAALNKRNPKCVKAKESEIAWHHISQYCAHAVEHRGCCTPGERYLIHFQDGVVSTCDLHLCAGT